LLRLKIPTRSEVEAKKSYKLYRKELAADFNRRCGYCDAHDDILWARGSYHIDHFAPHSKFPELKETYSNLVYSCPFCNRAKSSKWFSDSADEHNDGEKGFIDPCSTDYDKHLSRLEDGRIVPTTDLGRHLMLELKLQLVRHRMAWQSEAFHRLRERVDLLLDNPLLKDTQQMALLKEFRELTKLYEYSKRAAL
jgi:uncharacterized protein (TIGR02646 family)